MTTTKNIKIKTIFETFGAESLKKDLVKLQLGIHDINSLTKKYGRLTLGGEEGLKRISKGVRTFNTQLGNQKKQTR